MIRTIALAAGALSLAACQPAAALVLAGDTGTWSPDGATGHVLCDRQVDIVAEIEAEGWTVDCTPDFPAVRGDTGAPIWGWTDTSRRTVWLWPERWEMEDRDVRVGLWHELHHVLGGRSEDDAMMFSFCRERPPGGAMLLAAVPTPERCAAVGA